MSSSSRSSCSSHDDGAIDIEILINPHIRGPLVVVIVVGGISTSNFGILIINILIIAGFGHVGNIGLQRTVAKTMLVVVIIIVVVASRGAMLANHPTHRDHGIIISSFVVVVIGHAVVGVIDNAAVVHDD